MKKSGELLKVKIKTCDEEFLEEVKRDFDTKYIDLYRNLDKKGIQKEHQEHLEWLKNEFPDEYKKTEALLKMIKK